MANIENGITNDGSPTGQPRSTRILSACTAEEENRMMYVLPGTTEAELDKQYPDRPRNHGLTPPFHTLFTQIFNPLNELRNKPARPARAAIPGQPARLPPSHLKAAVLAAYIARWRADVGSDVYPAFRLIAPDRDRDRALYGLKEKAIGKILIKVLRISRDSDDGHKLLNWKLPSKFASCRTAGDFAGRCFDAIAKRPVRTDVGDMSIGEVNVKLDQLAAAGKESEQAQLIEQFYFRMNAEEMMWLIRIILRQMKIGMSEKIIFRLWHLDADALFNISSNMRKVCWQLHDPTRRLNADESSVTAMECFQPQLAAYQYHSLPKIIARMRMPTDDQTFWIEEKLDGERMQLHLVRDESVPGGCRLAFWSRRAKDYTYLYGRHFDDETGALSRFLRPAFSRAVQSIILDGEMVVWDTAEQAVLPFGTLKSAALAEQQNPFSNTQRPLYRVFDCLYVNGRSLTGYALRERRKALAATVRSVECRLELHPYRIASTTDEIEVELRKIIEEAGEGLVVKNPRSGYHLNERHDDWIKVKPEYMSSFGEELDCIVVGGYYGNGRRGGILASFLCGLRVDQDEIDKGASAYKTHSFFKVGGGFSAADYADIRLRTDGKWTRWDPSDPPFDIVELAGGRARQLERPDMWIRPQDSVVVSVKAASVQPSDSFRTGITLRFPRFKCIRFDKTWRDALSVQGFHNLRENASQDQTGLPFDVDTDRKTRRAAQAGPNKRRALNIVGARPSSAAPAWTDAHQTGGKEDEKLAGLFSDLVVFVMTEAVGPVRRFKAEIETFVAAHGGRLVQTHTAGRGNENQLDVVCIADREPVKVRAIKQKGDRSIIRPIWLYDCLEQAQKDAACSGSSPVSLLPREPRHLFFTAAGDEPRVAATVDRFGDSFARDISGSELAVIFAGMTTSTPSQHDSAALSESGETMVASLLSSSDDAREGSTEADKVSLACSKTDDTELSDLFMFFAHRLYLDLASSAQVMDGLPSRSDLELEQAGRRAVFLHGRVEKSLLPDNSNRVTHVVLGHDRSRLPRLRSQIAQYWPVPKIVSFRWIEECWKEKTLLDDDRFVV